MAAVGFKVAAGVNRYGFASLRRLKTPAEFSALLRAPRERSIRAERQMLSINAAWVTAGVIDNAAGSVRFGVTVGKRNARRSVDRALVKRIVREACRHYAHSFENCAAQAAARIDIALRLRAPLVDARGVPLAMRAWRRQVRADPIAVAGSADAPYGAARCEPGELRGCHVIKTILIAAICATLLASPWRGEGVPLLADGSEYSMQRDERSRRDARGRMTIARRHAAPVRFGRCRSGAPQFSWRCWGHPNITIITRALSLPQSNPS